jgi:predicted secreted protein
MHAVSTRYFVRWTWMPGLIFFLAGVAGAAGINDTGVTSCFSGTTGDSVTVATDNGSYPRQDCRYGRDAAQSAGKLGKTGAGAKGFDFTKISNSGTVLPSSAALGTGGTDWACTRDNVTGLIWEVKTNSGLRSLNYTYTWYKSDSSTNGGDPGTASTGSSFTCATGGRCDTEKFRTDVSNQSLCGATNWRLPTRRELGSIVDYGRTSPPLDIDYFPNTPASAFWSDTADGKYSGFAWQIDFDKGLTSSIDKGIASAVRLVRTGP